MYNPNFNSPEFEGIKIRIVQICTVSEAMDRKTNSMCIIIVSLLLQHIHRTPAIAYPELPYGSPEWPD